MQWSIEDAAPRLDQWLVQQLPHLTRGNIQRGIAEGCCLLNGKHPRKKSPLCRGDTITWNDPTFLEPPKAQPLPLEILYEEEEWLVLNKAPGMVVHPTTQHRSDTVVHGLLHHCTTLPGAPERAGIVHRLDRDTSGLLLIAKTASMLTRLQELFQKRMVQKGYLALCKGGVEQQSIVQPLGRDPSHPQRRAIRRHGKEAITHVYPLHYRAPWQWLLLQPKTGRTHQLRVHMASINRPLMGDTLYGTPQAPRWVQRHYLHAWRLTLPLPGHTPYTFTAPLPSDMQTHAPDALESLANQAWEEDRSHHVTKDHIG